MSKLTHYTPKMLTEYSLFTLLVSRSEQVISTDNGFILKKINENEIPRALSELPANWPGRFSQKGWLGLAS